MSADASSPIPAALDPLRDQPDVHGHDDHTGDDSFPRGASEASFASRAYGDPWQRMGTPADDVPPSEETMIILGVILLVVGLVAGIGILWTIGVILVAIGIVLWVLGAMGREVGGRRHYW